MKKFFTKNFFVYWLPIIIWAGIIFWLSSIPSLKSGFAEDFILRKIAHAFEFAVLTFLLFRAINGHGYLGSGGEKVVIYSFVIAVLYALSDELHQLFVVGRHGSIWDVGIDTIGILIATLLCYIKYRKGRY